jgi:hypothetical protein
MTDRPMILPPESYADNHKIPKLVEYVEELMKHDVSDFWVDIGEKNVGTSINWKSIIVNPYDIDAYYTFNQGLEDIAKHIMDHAKIMKGVERFAINVLFKASLIPIHVDDDTRPEYDNTGRCYNILIPLYDHGYSIVDYKLIKNKARVPLVFDGQLPHGGMNDTLETRITIFLNVNKEAFNVASE